LISVITVKRAYDDLEAEGLIANIQGKGAFVAVQNTELFRERRLRVVEGAMEEAVTEAKRLGLSLGDLRSMLDLLYEEEGNV